MSDLACPRPRHARARRLWPGFVSVTCLLRSLPRFAGAEPATPLRVLAIIALDTLHVLRTSRPLSRRKVRTLAMLLDFQACANAAWDDKHVCMTGYQSLRQRLVLAGLEPCIDTYLARLRDLETRRPSIGGDARRFDEVRSYREDVARLSLATLLWFALDTGRLEHVIQDTDADSDVGVLFRIAMQCQIVDDVVDYVSDRAAALPSFLTACASLPQALALTAAEARRYARGHGSASRRGILPLRMALHVCTALAGIVLAVVQRRHRRDRLRQDGPLAACAATVTRSRESVRSSRDG